MDTARREETARFEANRHWWYQQRLMGFDEKANRGRKVGPNNRPVIPPPRPQLPNRLQPQPSTSTFPRPTVPTVAPTDPLSISKSLWDKGNCTLLLLAVICTSLALNRCTSFALNLCNLLGGCLQMMSRNSGQILTPLYS